MVVVAVEGLVVVVVVEMAVEAVFWAGRTPGPEAEARLGDGAEAGAGLEAVVVIEVVAVVVVVAELVVVVEAGGEAAKEAVAEAAVEVAVEAVGALTVAAVWLLCAV